MKAEKKPHGITMLSGGYRPESQLNLEGKHANTVKSHQIGAKVQMVLTATKHSHNMNADGTNSAGYHVHSVKMQDKDELGGPNKKESENEANSSESHQ